MKKIIQDENFAEILQILIKVHHEYPKMTLFKILENVAGISDLMSISDEDLLARLSSFYAYEKRK